MRGGEGGWRWLKILLIFAILFVIQMRLVWMQLREFRVQNSPRTEMSMDFLDQFRGSACLRSSVLGMPTVSAPQLPRVNKELQNSQSASISTLTQSPGVTALLGWFFCDGERVSDQTWIKVNQWIYVSAVVLAALAARILGRSWTLALFAAATLMTRGSLLTGIGDFGGDNYVMLGFTAWFAATVHFLRSGSIAAFVACAASVILGGLFDPSLLVVGLGLPIFIGAAFIMRVSLVRPLLLQVRNRMRGMRQRAAWARKYVLAAPIRPTEAGDNFFWSSLAATRRFVGLETPRDGEPISWRSRYERGSLFRPAEVPFLLWAIPESAGFLRWRPLFLALASVGIVVLGGVGVLVAYQWLGATAGIDLPAAFRQFWAAGANVVGWEGRWYFEVFTVFDFHLLISLGLTLWSASQSPASGLTGYFEAVWVFLIATAMLAVAALGLDLIDSRLLKGAFSWLGGGQLFSHRQVLVWIQPVLLMLGVTSAFNMLKVTDNRLKRSR